ncbi:hypothetical protein [Flagellimonas aequoris]|nr:hypothetical protein [Allomuricauda aequoris]TXK01363.1 hypothetical protein FQ019_11435 [Allomuricauda aequoris]
MDEFSQKYWFIGFILISIGLLYFVFEGKNLFNWLQDKDYILASNSIKKFGASIILIAAGLVLINQKLGLI